MSFTQAICGCCWQAYALGRDGEITQPCVTRHPAKEICCTCGGNAAEGIYIRVDPAQVLFPREEK